MEVRNMSKEFRKAPGCQMEGNTMDGGNVEDVEFSREETAAQMRAHEEDFIQGLIDAAGYRENETQRIEIIRGGKLYFAFTIRPLSSEEYEKCRKKHTRFVRNKQLGMKLPEETDRTKYNSAVIYEATVEEDRRSLWDNRKVWNALIDRDFQILSGLDVIEYTMMAGEKDMVLEAIDRLSGFGDSMESGGLEETAKK